jgi:hypothetical protein
LKFTDVYVQTVSELESSVEDLEQRVHSLEADRRVAERKIRWLMQDRSRNQNIEHRKPLSDGRGLKSLVLKPGHSIFPRKKLELPELNLECIPCSPESQTSTTLSLFTDTDESVDFSSSTSLSTPNEAEVLAEPVLPLVQPANDVIDLFPCPPATIPILSSESVLILRDALKKGSVQSSVAKSSRSASPQSSRSKPSSDTFLSKKKHILERFFSSKRKPQNSSAAKVNITKRFVDSGKALKKRLQPLLIPATIPLVQHACTPDFTQILDTPILHQEPSTVSASPDDLDNIVDIIFKHAVAPLDRESFSKVSRKPELPVLIEVAEDGDLAQEDSNEEDGEDDDYSSFTALPLYSQPNANISSLNLAVYT